MRKHILRWLHRRGRQVPGTPDPWTQDHSHRAMTTPWGAYLRDLGYLPVRDLWSLRGMTSDRVKTQQAQTAAGTLVVVWLFELVTASSCERENGVDPERPPTDLRPQVEAALPVWRARWQASPVGCVSWTQIHYDATSARLMLVRPWYADSFSDHWSWHGVPAVQQHDRAQRVLRQLAPGIAWISEHFGLKELRRSVVPDKLMVDGAGLVLADAGIGHLVDLVETSYSFAGPERMSARELQNTYGMHGINSPVLPDPLPLSMVLTSLYYTLRTGRLLFTNRPLYQHDTSNDLFDQRMQIQWPLVAALHVIEDPVERAGVAWALDEAAGHPERPWQDVVEALTGGEDAAGGLA